MAMGRADVNTCYRCSMDQLPASVGEIPDALLTEVLRTSGVLVDERVAAHQVLTAADTGLLSSAGRVRLLYEGAGSGLPETVWVKLTPADASDAIGELSRTEAGFYTHAAAALGRAVPQCFGVAWDGARRAMLVLEDLSDYEIGNWWTYTAADAAGSLRSLAGIHARSWTAPPPGWVWPGRLSGASSRALNATRNPQPPRSV